MRAIQIARQEPETKQALHLEGSLWLVLKHVEWRCVCVSVCVFFALPWKGFCRDNVMCLADIIGMVAQVELEHWQALQLP